MPDAKNLPLISRVTQIYKLFHAILLGLDVEINIFINIHFLQFVQVLGEVDELVNTGGWVMRR